MKLNTKGNPVASILELSSTELASAPTNNFTHIYGLRIEIQQREERKRR